MQSLWYFFSFVTILHCCHVEIIRHDPVGFRNEPGPEYAVFTCVNVSTFGKLIPHQLRNHSFAKEFLNITQSDISNVPPSAFQEFTTLIKLNLSHNHIKAVSPGGFDNLTLLEELYLDHNQLENVPNDCFSSLINLEILDLSDNQISKLDNGTFFGLTKLNKIFLSNNKLTTFEDTLRRKQIAIRELDLSRNLLENVKIAFLPIDYRLYNLPNGKRVAIFTLNLSHNQMSKIDGDVLPTTLYLDLSYNGIISIINLESLGYFSINLSHNRLTKINGTFSYLLKNITVSHNELDTLQDVFNQSKKLEKLDVAFNQISAVSSEALTGLTSLKDLSLNNNKLSKIEPVLFIDLVSLKHLNLSHNNFKNFQFGTFDALSNLEVIDISYNQLTDIQHSFASLKSLSELYFANNQISCLDIESFQSSHPKLKYSSPDNNLITC